jgi:hypothetical protein
LDPNDRLGARDMSELKEHPFFHGHIDWDNIRTQKVPIVQKKKLFSEIKPRSQFDLLTKKDVFSDKVANQHSALLSVDFDYFGSSKSWDNESKDALFNDQKKE